MNKIANQLLGKGKTGCNKIGIFASLVSVCLGDGEKVNTKGSIQVPTKDESSLRQTKRNEPNHFSFPQDNIGWPGNGLDFFFSFDLIEF